MKTESKLITALILLMLVAGVLSFKMMQLQERIQGLDKKLEEVNNEPQTAVIEKAILLLATF